MRLVGYLRSCSTMKYSVYATVPRLLSCRMWCHYCGSWFTRSRRNILPSLTGFTSEHV